jgi:hypothetical protein
MKIISKQLGLFAILFSIYTVSFRYLLSDALQDERFSIVWLYAVFYAVIIFITAWHLGKAEGIKRILFDAGLRFHVTTYLCFGIISELWFILDFNADNESISIVHYTLIFWGLGLLLHFAIFFMLRKDTIRGIAKSDIFD